MQLFNNLLQKRGLVIEKVKILLFIFLSIFIFTSITVSPAHSRDNNCTQKKYIKQKLLTQPLSECLPVEGVWQGGRVRQWALFLTWELLFYSKGVIINNHWHHSRQEAGHYLQILKVVVHDKWTSTTCGLKRYLHHLCSKKKKKTEPQFEIVFCGDFINWCTDTRGDMLYCTYQSRLLEDLAVNHVPRSLTQWQHPEQEHQVWTVLFTHTYNDLTFGWHDVRKLCSENTF